MRKVKALLYCCRCGCYKDASKFSADEKYWSRWCKKCRETPTGEIPKG